MHLLAMKALPGTEKAASKEGKRHVSEIKDDLKYDLGDCVELTKSGKHWTERIKAFRKTEEE